MNKIVFILIVFVNISFVHASENPLAIAGIWHTGESNTLVEIVIDDKTPPVGKLLKSDNAKAKIGTLILSALQQQENHWQGKIFAMKRGEHYPVVITRQDDKLLLAVDVGFFTKEVEWQLHIYPSSFKMPVSERLSNANLRRVN